MSFPPQRHGPASQAAASAPPTPQDPGVKTSASMTGSDLGVATDTCGEMIQPSSPGTSLDHHAATTGPTARATTGAGIPPPARRTSSPPTTGSDPDADMDGSTVVDPDEALSGPDGDSVDNQRKRQAVKNGKAVWTRYCDVQPLTRPAAAALAAEKPSAGGGGGGYYDVEPDEKARRDWEAAQEREMERWALGSMIDCGWED